MAEKKKRIEWLRYLLGGSLLTLLLLALFYQPILFGIAQFAGQQIAKSQSFVLRFKIHGSIFSNLSLEDVHFAPLPTNKDLPIERLDIKRIEARYDLVSLLKKNYLNVVDLVELQNIDLVIRPGQTSPPPKKKPAAIIPKVLVIIPKKIDIQNVNVTVRDEKGDINVRQFALQFQQGQTGYISCEQIILPQIAEWKNLKAGLNYQNNHIELSGLGLEPVLDLHSLDLDLTGAANGRFALKLDAAGLGAPITADVSVNQSGDQAVVNATAKLSDLHFEKISKVAPIPVQGVLEQARINLAGDLNHPTSLSGALALDASDIHYQACTVERANVAIDILNGHGTIKKIAVNSGVNRVRASGDFQLPETLDGVATKSKGSLGIAIGSPDVSAFAPGVVAPTLLEGSVFLNHSRAQIYLQAATSGIRLPTSAPGLTIGNVHSHLLAIVTIPVSAKIWPSIAALALSDLNAIAYQDGHVDQVLVNAEANDGKKTNIEANIHSGTSSVRITANTVLPTSDRTFDPNKVVADLQVRIASLADFLHQPLPGTFTAKGDVHLEDLKPNGSITAAGNQIQYRGISIQDFGIDTRFENKMARIRDAKIVFNPENFIRFDGSAALSDPFPYETNGTVQIADLGIFNEVLKTLGQEAGLAGRLSAQWSAKGDARQAIPEGKLRVAGDQIKYRGLTIQSTDIDAVLIDRNLNVPSLKIVFNDKNSIDSQATASLRDPINYEAKAKVDFKDLGFLNDLLKTFGQEIGLGGQLKVDWTGKGEAKSSSGKIEVHADSVETTAIQGIKADLTGNYDGLKAEVPRLQVETPFANLDTSIHLSPDFFEIPTLAITRNGNAIKGNVKIPIELGGNSKSPLNLDRPIEVNIEAEKIALASLQPGKPAVTGTVGLKIQASKTLRDPLVEFRTTANDVRAASVPSFQGANSEILIRLADKVLTISGKIQQPDINPVDVNGKIPLDLGQIIQSGTIPDETPIALSIKWPNNKLAFIRKIVPDIKILEGTANVDVNVAGTVKRPQVTGVVQSTIARFSAKTDTVPPIKDFVTKIAFKENRVQIEQLQGLAGGGAFNGGGAIDLADGKDPKFDIGINGKQVLLTRSDGLIARSNIALKIQGPLSAGAVTGTVGVTNSRFFKEIDILPLNLPGRPPPRPPSGALPNIAVTAPPFNNWKFDIAIRTDDPILIQSNLARGQIRIALHAGGTGASPSVIGAVTVERLVASLPFSKMEIRNGTVNWVQGGSILDPTLSITGRSAVRDYEIRARIFGTVSNPTVLMDSSPPLAQGDILVLLATGSTTSEFAQNPDLLVGRASFIVVQQLLGKFFPSTNRADAQKEPFIDRFDVEVIPGRKVGEQEISTRFKLTDNWQIIGDIGSTSYQGRLKYLLRFR